VTLSALTYGDEHVERRAVAPLVVQRVVQFYAVRPARRDALGDDLDLDHHSRFEVARYMAGKLIAPRLGKGPL
jgi:hypothetical protein